MNESVSPDQLLLSRALIFKLPTSTSHSAHWRINGYSATIIVWTDAQWERLDPRPTDAQYLGGGVWCALRVE